MISYEGLQFDVLHSASFFFVVYMALSMLAIGGYVKYRAWKG